MALETETTEETPKKRKRSSQRGEPTAETSWKGPVENPTSMATDTGSDPSLTSEPSPAETTETSPAMDTSSETQALPMSESSPVLETSSQTAESTATELSPIEMSPTTETSPVLDASPVTEISPEMEASPESKDLTTSSESSPETETPTQAELPGTESESPTPDDREVSRALEALIFAAHGPASATHLRRAFPDLTPARLAELVKQTNEALSEAGRPYEIVEVAGGYQFRTRAEYGPVIAGAQPERKVRLSHAALDTLAVVAYRQPITRAEIEEMRSVDCGAVIRSLLDRHLLRIVGRRDAPGRPALYGTSANFLEVFGLRSLRDLPELRKLIEPAAEEGIGVEEAGGPPPDANTAERVEQAVEEARAAVGVEPETFETGEPGPAAPPAARTREDVHSAEDEELDRELADLAGLNLGIDLDLNPDGDDDGAEGSSGDDE